MKKILMILPLLLFSGCLGYPEGVTPVSGFDVDRYLGKWYEIARLDHSFERGLTQVTAEYSLLDDGGIRVINRGFSVEDKSWQVAEGKAYFVRNVDEAYLKVSFFGPFYGSYVVFELEPQNYSYAFVASSNKSYLWLLSRTPRVGDDIMKKFRLQAKQLGYNLDELIYLNHE